MPVARSGHREKGRLPAASAIAAERAKSPPKLSLAQRVQRIIDGVDQARWQQLRERWLEGGDYTYRDHYPKYFDLARWLPGAVKAAGQAGLIGAAPRRVLDIGCGAGLFGRVCRDLGHEHVGLDIGNPMFRDMCAALGVTDLVHPVVRQERLPADLRSFDAIVALAATFYWNEIVDNAKIEANWQLADWLFFLADLRGRLNEGGVFLIKLNAMEDIPGEVMRLFEPAEQLAYNIYRFRRERLPG